MKTAFIPSLLPQSHKLLYFRTKFENLFFWNSFIFILHILHSHRNPLPGYAIVSGPIFILYISYIWYIILSSDGRQVRETLLDRHRDVRKSHTICWQCQREEMVLQKKIDCSYYRHAFVTHSDHWNVTHCSKEWRKISRTQELVFRLFSRVRLSTCPYPN